jgi:DNA adenine methylase
MRSRSRLVRRSTVAPKTSRSRKAIAADAPAAPALAHPAAAPVVKWVGGKTRLLPELRARLPLHINRYYEPFAGGAALFFATQPARAVLSDDNRDLIGTYRAVAGDVAALMRRLELHRREHSETHYYGMRARWNDASVSWTPIDRAAAFIYLNKTCYNGLWRVNRSGAFNVPIGRYVEPTIFSSEALQASSAALGRAELRCGDFRRAVADAGQGDFVYFDPPYDPLTKTANFTSYTAGCFGDDDQRELAELVRALAGRGCRVMLSNSDTPFIRGLYKGLRVDRVSCARAINSNASRRGSVDEVLVTAGY